MNRSQSSDGWEVEPAAFGDTLPSFIDHVCRGHGGPRRCRSDDFLINGLVCEQKSVFFVCFFLVITKSCNTGRRGAEASALASCLRHSETSRAQAKPHQASEASIENKYNFAALFLTIQASHRLEPDVIRGPCLYLSAAPVFPPNEPLRFMTPLSLHWLSTLSCYNSPPRSLDELGGISSLVMRSCVQSPRLARCPLEERGWVGGPLEKKKKRRKKTLP